MPRLLPVSYPVTLEQIRERNARHTNIEMSAEDMFARINQANTHLAKLNLDRGALHIPEEDEVGIIKAAEQSLAFLQDYFLCFQTQNSLARQLGIYYAYHKSNNPKAQANFIVMHYRTDTLEDAQAFMYSGYTNLLSSKFHDDSILTKANHQMLRLSENPPIDPMEKIDLLVDKSHTYFLLALTGYRKNDLTPVAETGKLLETASECLQLAINHQTEALTLIDDLDLKLQVLVELTNSWRLACVISYKLQDIFNRDSSYAKAEQYYAEMTTVYNLIKVNSPSVRIAQMQDKFVAEFATIKTAIQLQTGSTTAIAGMYGEIRQAASNASMQTQIAAPAQDVFRPAFG
jgi:hypothetical protein